MKLRKGLGRTSWRSERRLLGLGHPSGAQRANTTLASPGVLGPSPSPSPPCHQSILSKFSAVPSFCCLFALFIESLMVAQSWARGWQPRPSCFSQHHLTFSFILALCEPSKSPTIDCCFCFIHLFIHSNVCRSVSYVPGAEETDVR